MKTIICILLFCLSYTVIAQDKPTKNDKATVEVLGNCKMCKERIEKAALSVKGVKYASWDIPSGNLSFIYNGLKTDVDSVEIQISAVGHDTKNYTAKSSIYNELPGCCQYVRRGKVAAPGQATKH